jgi:16S rRNA (guanine527-N7)-methyltransferase
VNGKFQKAQFNALPNGILYLKGGDLSEELAVVKQAYKVWSLADFYKEDFFETKKVVHIRM